MIKLYTDAATKGNPGPTGLGMLVVKDGQQQQLKAFCRGLPIIKANLPRRLKALPI